MRARRGLILGWVVVGLYAAAIVAVTVTTRDGELRPGDRPSDGDAAEAFVDAWERSRQATFVRSGTFERRSETTGAVITSEDVLAQRPPRRLHRQLGGVDGRDDRRTIVCPAPPAGSTDAPACTFGDPAGPTYDEDVATEVAALRTLVEGPLPRVRRRTRSGTAASSWRSCAPSRGPRSVSRPGSASTRPPARRPTAGCATPAGIVEVVAVTSLIAHACDDADLEP